MAEPVFGLTHDGIRRTAEANRRVLGETAESGGRTHRLFPTSKITKGIVVDAVTAASAPLTGATCFMLRPICNTGDEASEPSCGNRFEQVVDRINRQRVLAGLDELDADACDLHCVNRSVNARADAGTFAKVDHDDGENSLVWLDCDISEEGLEMIIEGGPFGGMGGGAMGVAALGG